MKVVMEHPNLGPDRRQTVDGEQFYLAWQPAGWTEVEIIHETGDTEFEEAVPVSPPKNSWELEEGYEAPSESKKSKKEAPPVDSPSEA